MDLNIAACNTLDLFDRKMRLESLEAQVRAYAQQIERHPIARICERGELPLSIAKECARIQYVDSVLWIPMLALIKGKVSSPRLIRAVRENILCEAGYDGIPHVTLCKTFVESLGEPSQYGDCTDYAPLSAHPIAVMNGMIAFTEEEIAGWLMASESLVPTFFRIFRAAYEKIPGVDLRYLNEHITVDSDEHALWMREAVLELLHDEESYRKVLAGIDVGARLVLSIPDVMYSRTQKVRSKLNE